MHLYVCTYVCTVQAHSTCLLSQVHHPSGLQLQYHVHQSHTPTVQGSGHAAVQHSLEAPPPVAGAVPCCLCHPDGDCTEELCCVGDRRVHLVTGILEEGPQRATVGQHLQQVRTQTHHHMNENMCTNHVVRAPSCVN